MMHFDEDGKHVKSGDIHNSNISRSIDQLSHSSNGACKGICLQYRSPTSRYENNQKRCKKCEIFITIEGTKGAEGLFCKCCNIRVSGVPSKSMYKENYRNQEQNKTTQNKPESFSEPHKPWTDVTEDYQNMSDDDSNEKKSTPVYDVIDESVKTFYEFKDFLEGNLRPQANYQFVMLHELLNYGKLHKGEIAESLAYFNNKNTTNIDEVKYYFNVPVYDVLVDHGFVTKHNPSEFDVSLPHYSLNVKFEEMQRIRLLEYLSNQITKYNQEHNIPENEFPESNNMENFNWRTKYPKSNTKSNIDNEIDKESANNSYVTKFSKFFKKSPSTPSRWIWSVTSENWEILKSTNIWGSRISKVKIGDKVKPGDQVVFYVVGTGRLKGIFEFVGGWYDSPGETWNDDLKPDGSLMYVSQIQIKPIQLGTITIHSLHDKLDVFLGKSPANRNLVLQSGNGYPSNNNKSLSENDFAIIQTELRRNRYDLSENSSTVEEKIENTVIPTSVSETVETKIFNFNNGELNIQNCKVLSTDIIKKDQILTNDEIISTFKVGNMGGIRYTKRNDVIVLLSTHSDDSIDNTSGFIIYTGEGKGNQELKNGNEKILNSQNTPMVYFKEVYQEPGVRTRGALDNKYKFVGVVKFHKYNWATEKNRKVIKFVLGIVS
jgi:predicted RNA-binding protein